MTAGAGTQKETAAVLDISGRVFVLGGHGARRQHKTQNAKQD
jgi:hypothetical protein